MADKRGEERKNNRVLTSRGIPDDLPENETLTLPSADKPAQPPKGKNKDPKNVPSPVEEESENP